MRRSVSGQAARFAAAKNWFSRMNQTLATRRALPPRRLSVAPMLDGMDWFLIR